MVELVVATVRKAHGLAGEVLVELATDAPDEVFATDRVFSVRGGGSGGPQRLTLTGTRPHKGGLLLEFREIRDRTAADRLRGVDLCLSVDELRPLDDDEFFVHDLVGYSVERTGGEVIGKVVTSYETGAQLLLGVESGGGELLVPFGKQLVREVDREARRIVIDPPPGLLEE
jgi:16S rRNA processing protein RimM